MQPEIIIFSIVAFLYGIVIGSFLNVLIYRIPLKENIATERSHCMKCSHQLQWYDLVPLFSYIFLKGKCRYCHAKISVQYPLIEGFNGFGYVLIILAKGLTAESIFDCLLLSILIVIAVIDWRTFEIPVSLNIAILVIAIGKLLLCRENLMEHLIGFFAVSGFLLLIFIFTRGRGIGGGDIKLMAVAGLYLGWKNVILALAIGSIAGAVIHLALMRFYNKDRMLAFGPYLAVGIIIAALFGNGITGWYISLLV